MKRKKNPLIREYRDKFRKGDVNQEDKSLLKTFLTYCRMKICQILGKGKKLSLEGMGTAWPVYNVYGILPRIF